MWNYDIVEHWDPGSGPPGFCGVGMVLDELKPGSHVEFWCMVDYCKSPIYLELHMTRANGDGLLVRSEMFDVVEGMIRRR